MKEIKKIAKAIPVLLGIHYAILIRNLQQKLTKEQNVKYLTYGAYHERKIVNLFNKGVEERKL